MNEQPLRVGTRGSDLALWQAETVADLLLREAPHRGAELVIVKTLGDREKELAIGEIGRTGVFTVELDRALLAGDVDLAVHSLKDVETTLPDGVVLGAVLPRGPVEDVLVGASDLAELPAGARVGTGSVRRAAQLRRARPDLAVTPIRGNVPSRLASLDAGGHDALVLARAGLVRLGLAHRIGAVLDPEVFLPAVGQGAVAVACRADDAVATRILGNMNHAITWRAVRVERACLRELGGGCNVPLGMFCSVVEGRIRVRAAVYSGTDPARAVEVEREGGPDDDAEELGREVCRALREGGAEALLREAR